VKFLLKINIEVFLKHGDTKLNKVAVQELTTIYIYILENHNRNYKVTSHKWLHKNQNSNLSMTTISR
jgi:hypothetical protein